jgi:RNA polymerase sigma factor (sigma-70 family)
MRNAPPERALSDREAVVEDDLVFAQARRIFPVRASIRKRIIFRPVLAIPVEQIAGARVLRTEHPQTVSSTSCKKPMNGFRFPTTSAEVIELRLDQAALRALAEASELEHLVAEVFAVLKDPVYRYLVSLLGTPAVAEDVLQETFIKLLEQLQRGHAVEQVRAWVFRVAHNTAISELRRRHRQEADFPADWESLAVLQPASEPNAEQRLLEAERHSKLQHGLRLLSAQNGIV